MTKSQFSQDFRVVSSRITEILSTLLQPENATFDLWTQWTELSGQQRLLQCCYILEYQQAILLARAPQSSLFQYSGFDLPFPSHSNLWEAANPMDWAVAAQQFLHFPTSVYEIVPDMSIGPFDQFQSLLLIAAHYNHFNNTAIYLSPPVIPCIEHLLDCSVMTKHALLTAKLLQVTPIRALLAVSGETWILSEKVPTPAAFHSFKLTLRAWLAGLWTSSADQQSQAVREALKISIQLLQDAISMSAENIHHEMGTDMSLYYAALVIFAVTVTSNNRVKPTQTPPQPTRFQSQSPVSPHPFSTTSSHLSVNPIHTLHSPSAAHPSTEGFMQHSITSPVQTPASKSMVYSEVTSTSISFLEQALLEVDFIGMVPPWPTDISYWQQGCAAVMRWVKMQLRSGSPKGRDSVTGAGPTSAGRGRGGNDLGEVLNGAVASLEKILGQGWEGWGI